MASENTQWAAVIITRGAIKVALQPPGAPLLARVFIETGKQPAGTNPVDLAAQLHGWMIAAPIVSSLLGIGWCLMMMIYFGGRRGRAVDGLGVPPGGGG